uniref:Uncharacterized protein n=1 Tax=Siphoviridae sp. ctnot10 TaxID=2826458 RepID=A0A8S5NCN3_9CAUD|nr:MAG TPA: hypothetical protein [Siphoviridae sp. ctnot10]
MILSNAKNIVISTFLSTTKKYFKISYKNS